LRRKYKPFEMRRKLAGSHDVFLCDREIQPQLLSVLGKSFFHKNKFPFAIDLTGDVAAQVSSAKSSTLLHQSAGTTWVIKIGSTSWDARKLAENAITASNNAIAKCVAGRWQNIRGIHIKSDTSVALPVYDQLAPIGLHVEGASVPSISKKRADPRLCDDAEENRELLELAREAELDVDEDFRFDVEDNDLEENDIEVRPETKTKERPPSKKQKKEPVKQLVARGPAKKQQKKAKK
jgi:ribosome biogenesis protein UTP30